MKQKAVIIYNPRSGKGQFVKHKEQIENMFKNSIYTLELYETKYQKDATTKAIEYANKEYDLIIASGGDGTLHEVVNGLMQCNYKNNLGYIPSGTTNDFAKSIKIPLNPISATKIILNGKTQEIDIGQINDNFFVYVTGFGAFTPISYTTDSKMKADFGYLAYLLSAKKELRKIENYKVSISVDDQKRQKFNALTTIIANSRDVAGFHRLLPDAKVNDGIFDLLLFEVTSKNPIKLLFNYLIRLFNGFYRKNTNKPKINNGIRHMIGKKFEIETNKPVTWNVDGEQGITTSKVTVQVHHKALKIFVI